MSNKHQTRSGAKSANAPAPAPAPAAPAAPAAPVSTAVDQLTEDELDIAAGLSDNFQACGEEVPQEELIDYNDTDPFESSAQSKQSETADAQSKTAELQSSTNDSQPKTDVSQKQRISSRRKLSKRAFAQSSL
jgi:hypothetical protein